MKPCTLQTTCQSSSQTTGISHLEYVNLLGLSVTSMYYYSCCNCLQVPNSPIISPCSLTMAPMSLKISLISKMSCWGERRNTVHSHTIPTETHVIQYDAYHLCVALAGNLYGQLRLQVQCTCTMYL